MRRSTIVRGAAFIAVVAVLAVPTVAQAAPPVNDDIANATVVSAVPFSDSLNTSEATWSPSDPGGCTSNGSVWYAFTATSSGAVVADTFGSNYDTTLAAYSGSPGSLSLLACNDDFNGLQSRVSFSATAGTTYYILAGRCCGSGGNGGGNLVFHLSQVASPANDDFANATSIGSPPFSASVDTTGAGVESGEPLPSCGYGQSAGTIWYAFTPSVTASYSASAPYSGISSQIALYTGSGLNTLTQIGCRGFGQLLTFRAEAGTTYYLQVGGLFGARGSVNTNLVVAPSPVANLGYSPGDPSTFDMVQFYDASYDPAQVGIQSWSWDFGDGGTAALQSPTHRYAADGEYTVNLHVTTSDGRTASTTRLIRVATHDVSVGKILVPQSAGVGQTRSISVGIVDDRYPETVQVQLFKSGPSQYDPWQLVGTLTQSVPVRGLNRTTPFSFNYTFTADDALAGKVTFKAVATIIGARDALPADNTVISLATRVTP